MKKGTILYIGGFELPDKNAASHRVLSNAKIFRELNYNIVFIDCDKTLKYNVNVLKYKKNIQGFDCFSVSYPKTNKQWIHYLTNIDSVQKVLNQYNDVEYFVCYNYQSVALRRIMSLCKKKGIKVIGDCSEWYSSKGKGFVFSLIKGFDVFYRMRILQKKLDGLIVISDYLENYYSNCNNIINIPPLIDSNEDKWRIKAHKNNKIITIVYAGSPGNKDKINILVNALAMMDIEYRLNIVGITKKNYLEMYPSDSEIIDKVDHRICFIGRTTHLETLNYIKNADYSCFLREDNRVTKAGFPTKLVESIACGTPVITTNIGNISKYVDSGIKNGHIVNLMNFHQEIYEIIFQRKSLIIQCNDFIYNNYIEKVGKFINLINEKDVLNYKRVKQ